MGSLFSVTVHTVLYSVEVSDPRIDSFIVYPVDDIRNGEHVCPFSIWIVKGLIKPELWVYTIICCYMSTVGYLGTCERKNYTKKLYIYCLLK